MLKMNGISHKQLRNMTMIEIIFQCLIALLLNMVIIGILYNITITMNVILSIACVFAIVIISTFYSKFIYKKNLSRKDFKKLKNEKLIKIMDND